MRTTSTLSAFRALILPLVLSTTQAHAQVSLSFLGHWQITPTLEDSAGVFCRTFYHEGRNKYYAFYSGRSSTIGDMTDYRWQEFDAQFNATGAGGLLPGFTHGGDMAMVRVGTDFYHVTGAQPWGLQLSKFDEDMQLLGSTTFPTASEDSHADMMMNEVDGHLVIGTLHQVGSFHPTMPDQTTGWMPTMHRWEFGLDLLPMGPPVLMNEAFDPWGASCVQRSDEHDIITMSRWPNYKLNAYRYDNAWSYIDSVPLAADGQWSQGAIWSDPYYYVAYHSGHEHRAGNITVAVYDTAWALVYDTTITDNNVFVFNISPPLNTLQYNANRPFLTKVADTLIVSYDMDDYELASYAPPIFFQGHRWQAHVTKLLVNGLSTGVHHIVGTSEFVIGPGADPSLPEVITNAIGTLSVFDANGRRILQTSIRPGKTSIPIGGSADGVYLFQLITGHEVFGQRYVVCR